MKLSYFFICSLLTLILFSSCQKDDAYENQEVNQEVFVPQKTTDQGGPAKQEYYSSTSDIISMNNGCYTLQVRVYLNISGTNYLLHSAQITTGNCGRPSPPNSCLGEYKGDNIIFDSQLNGCIKDFFDREPQVYEAYLMERYQRFGI